MGSPAQSHLSTRRAFARRERRGIAILGALMALLTMSGLAAALFLLADLHAASTLNRERSARALQLADAGLSHAVALLRGPLETISLSRLLRGNDSLLNTPDDSLLIDYGLDTALQIPRAGRALGGGTYSIRLINDPLEPGTFLDNNFRVVARCTAVTSDGSVATVDAVIGVTPLPAIAVDGNLGLGGNPNVLGACGGVFANGNMQVSGTTTVQTTVAAAGTVTVSGNIRAVGGGGVTPTSGQPRVEIPDLNPADYCGTANYRLGADGYVTVVATGVRLDARSTDQFGWKRDSDAPVRWTMSGNIGTPGTYCISGNVNVSGNPGEGSALPLAMSIIATGSVEFSGNPKLTPSTSGLLILAGGDVSISGNPTGSSQNYSGLVYAGSQCKISGNPSLTGQVVCKNKPDAPGSINYADQNAISGNAVITYNCGGTSVGRRRILSWYRRFG